MPRIRNDGGNNNCNYGCSEFIDEHHERCLREKNDNDFCDDGNKIDMNSVYRKELRSEFWLVDFGDDKIGREPNR